MRRLDSIWLPVFSAVILGCIYSPAMAPRAHAAQVTTAETENVFSKEESSESELLPPMVISAPRFKPSMTPIEKYRLTMVLRFGALGMPVLNNEWVLTPERVPQRRGNSVYAVRVFEKTALDASTYHNLVGALRSTPATGSSRDADSAAGEAVIKGLSPRVFLDRTSVNDPFDGTVHWDELPDHGLARAEWVPCGGSSAWDQAPAGVIQLFSLPAMPRIVVDSATPANPDPRYAEPPRQTAHGTGVFAAEVGSFGSRGLEWVHTEPTDAGILQVFGHIAATNGFVGTAQGQRGTLDEPGWNRHRWLMARWRQLLGERVEVIASVKGAAGSRGLGTAYQREHDRSRFASLEFVGRHVDGFAWNGIVSAERRASGRTFSVVNDERSLEMPAIDHFAEPVTSIAASFGGAWHGWNDARSNVGLDLRRDAGETRSRLHVSEENLAQRYIAGGENVNAGIFAIHNRKLGHRWRAMVGARLDAWRQSDGFARKVEAISDTVLSDERAPDLSGSEFSPSVGLVWQPRNHWRVRAAGQGSFRTPTLAERYRTDGYLNRIVAPNSHLRAEHSRSAEITVEYAPVKTLFVAARIFTNAISDPVATRPTTALAADKRMIAVPYSTVEYRSRVNFERLYVRGADLSLRFAASEQLSIEAEVRLQGSALFDGAGGLSARNLEVPGIPRRMGLIGISWRPKPRVSIKAHVRWHGREFGNEENTIRFGESVVAATAIGFELNSMAEIFLRIDNITDHPIENARGADGTRYMTAPRTIVSGLRIAW